MSFNIDPGSVVGKHFHDCIELVYLVRGTLEFYDNNRRIDLKSNDFIVVSPMNIHSTRCMSGNTAILLQIPMDFLEKFVPDIRQYQFEVDAKSQDARVQTKIAKIREIMQDLLIANEFQAEGYLFRCYSLVFELIYILVHSFATKVDRAAFLTSEKNMKRMKQIMDYVAAHYQEDIPLSEIAQVVSLNQIYFSRFFKQQSGITFLEYLNTVRLEHIYQDVCNTDMPIKDILEKHRFYNYKLFMRMFKHAYGGTPKTVRRKNGT